MRSIMIIGALAAMCACSPTQSEKPSAIGTADDGKYTITSGAVVMTVDTNNGGRITSLTRDGKEALAQHQKIEGVPFENPNDHGSTFWPSPQSEWNWPPIKTYDSMPYSAVVVGDTLTLTSGEDEAYPYVIKKRFVPEADDAIAVTYTIVNNGASEVSVAPWEITRVPSGGYVAFECDSIWPEGVVEYTVEDGKVNMPFVASEKQRKIFADGKGWLSHTDGGMTLTKTFADIAQADAAPGEAEVEIYYNENTTYTEIESQGKYATLAPGAQLDWTVLWQLK